MSETSENKKPEMTADIVNSARLIECGFEEGLSLAADRPAAPVKKQGSYFRNPTMAEIYYRQGLLSLAADIYEELVEKNPYSIDYARRLAEIRKKMGPAFRGAG